MRFISLSEKQTQSESEWDSDAVFLYYFFYLIKRGCVMKIVKLQTVATATNLSETKK